MSKEIFYEINIENIYDSICNSNKKFEIGRCYLRNSNLPFRLLDNLL